MNHYLIVTRFSSNSMVAGRCTVESVDTLEQAKSQVDKRVDCRKSTRPEPWHGYSVEIYEVRLIQKTVIPGEGVGE